jgi:hypothetical protein
LIARCPFNPLPWDILSGCMFIHSFIHSFISLFSVYPHTSKIPWM